MSSEVRPDPKPIKIACPGCGKIRYTDIDHAARDRKRMCRSCGAKKFFRENGGSPLKGRGGKTCRRCGKAYSRGKGKYYCSKECRKADGQYTAQGEEMRSKRRGAGNPNFKHGRRVGVHASRWGVMEKGEMLCRSCLGEASHLHHIVPRSRWPQADRDDLRNGMPLCASCHTRWHRRTSPITFDLLRPEEIEYIVANAPLGPNPREWLLKNYPESPDQYWGAA